MPISKKTIKRAEPKIKFYFEIPAEMKSIKDYDKATAEAEARVPAIRKSLGL